jgi:hypothetical protein
MKTSFDARLLFRRRGRLWRELPPGTEWWEIELTARDLARLRSFPRNEWRRFAGGGFYLTEMVGRIEAGLARGQQSRFLTKIGAIASDLRGSHVPDAVLLIGTDEHHPADDYRGKSPHGGRHADHARIGAPPLPLLLRFSPNMELCCWHQTNLRSLTRYVRHTLRYMFRDGDFFIARACGRNSPRLRRPESRENRPASRVSRLVAGTYGFRDLWIPRHD